MTKTIKTLAVLSMLVLSTNANAADWTYTDGYGDTYSGWDNGSYIGGGNNTVITGPSGDVVGRFDW